MPAPTTLGSGGATGAGGGFGGFNAFLAMAGATLGAIGGFYSALNERNQLRSKALSAEFEASMANLNARLAEDEAQSILAAGQQEVGLAGLRAAQAAGAQRVSTARAGVQLGVGSAAELAASAEFAKQVDAMTMTSNAVRAAGQARLRAAEMAGRSLLAGASALNLRGAARQINPWAAAGGAVAGSFLGSAGTLGGGRY